MNVGKIDRILRTVVGLVLILAPLLTNLSIFNTAAMMYGTIIVGAVLVATAAFKFCPLYRLIGVNTCKM
jgi:hypothetical protein